MITATLTHATEESVIISQICRLLGEIDICLIRRQGHESDLQRRPMTCQGQSLEGGLWFFSTLNTNLTRLYGSSPQVTVAVSCPVLKQCAALSGKASIVNQKDRLAHFLVKANESLLPTGYDIKQLALLKIEVKQADFWQWPEDALIHSSLELNVPLSTGDPTRTLGGQRSSASQ